MDEGKGASRRLRRAGQVPAVVYGGGSEPQSVQLEQEKTWVASQKEWFYSSIIDLDVDGKVQKVLLRDMQRHPYKQLIMHLDFQRVNQNERSEEHTSELQSLMRISYAVFCLKKKNNTHNQHQHKLSSNNQ